MRCTVLLTLGTGIPLSISIVSGVAVAQDHDRTVQSLVAEARVAQARGDFAEAAEAYRKVTALEPTIPELWANLGLMYHESGNHSEAVKSLQQAARLNPSLFVPQLFLGLEYLQSNKPGLALPYLQSAVKLNPQDIQAVHSVGRAHAALGNSEKATELYWQAIQLDPRKGDLWFDLGTSYLQQVESDARLMTSAYRDSAYIKLRSAEVFAEQGKLIDAEEAYKGAIALTPPVPCRFAEFGITLLRQQKISAAREQFQHERQTGSHCGLEGLGLAMVDVASGNYEVALTRLAPMVNADPGFVRSNLQLFRGALVIDQINSLIQAARAQSHGDSSVDLAKLIESAFLSDEALPSLNGS